MAIAEHSKRIVPIEELWHLGQDLGKYVKNVQPRSSLQLYFTESEEG